MADNTTEISLNLVGNIQKELEKLGKVFTAQAESFAKVGTSLEGLVTHATNATSSMIKLKEEIATLKAPKIVFPEIKLPNIKEFVEGVNSLKAVKADKIESIKNLSAAVQPLNGLKISTTMVDLAEGISKLGAIKLTPALALNLSELATKVKEFSLTKDMKFPAMGALATGVTKLSELDTSGISAKFTTIQKALAGFQFSKELQFPNVAPLAEGVKVLNGLRINDISFTKKLETISESMKGLHFPEKVQFPNLQPTAEGVKILNAMPDVAKATANLTLVGEALANFKLGKDIKFPNISSLAKGVKDLDALKLDKDFAANVKGIGDALKGLDLGKTIKLPDLAGIGRGLDAITKIDVTAFSAKVKALGLALQELDKTGALQGFKGFAETLKNVSTAVERAGKSAQTAGEKFSGFTKRLLEYTQYRIVSTGIRMLQDAFQGAGKAITDYDQALKDLQAITSASGAEVAVMGTKIIEVATKTKFSAAEVAKGMLVLGQAGFSAAESIDTIQAVSDLATGTLADMAATVDLVSTAMRVFDITASDSGRVADVFANAVNKSKLTIDKLTTAFNYVGPIANDAGISFEETAATLMTLANSGMRASTIGTSLRNALSLLIDPSDKLAAAADKAGISLKQLDPQSNSLSSIIANLREVVTGAGDAFDIFGKRGASAILTLVDSKNGFDGMLDTVAKSGTAADMAAIQMEGLGVMYKNLQDRVEVFAISIGNSGITEVLKGVVSALKFVVSAMDTFVNSMVGGFIAKIVIGVGTLGTFVLVIGKLREAISALSTAVAVNTAAMAAEDIAALGLSKTTLALGSGISGATAMFKRLGVALMAFAAANPIIVAIGVAVAGVAAIMAGFVGTLTSYTEASERATASAVKFESLESGMEAYHAKIKDLTAGSTELKETNIALRKQLIETATASYDAADGTFAIAAAALDAAASIDPFTGALIGNGEALAAYNEQVTKLKMDKIVEAANEAAKAIDANTEGWAKNYNSGADIVVTGTARMVAGFGKAILSGSDFFKTLEKQDAKMNSFGSDIGASRKFAEAWDNNTATVEELAKHVASLDGIKFEDLSRQSQSLVTTFNGLDKTASKALNTLIEAGSVNVEMPEEAVTRMGEIFGLTGKALQAFTFGFKQLAEQSAKVKMPDLGTKLKDEFKDGTSAMQEYVTTYVSLGGVVSEEQQKIVDAAAESKIALLKESEVVEASYKRKIDAGVNEEVARKQRFASLETLRAKERALNKAELDDELMASMASVKAIEEKSVKDLKALEDAYTDRTSLKLEQAAIERKLEADIAAEQARASKEAADKTSMFNSNITNAKIYTDVQEASDKKIQIIKEDAAKQAAELDKSKKHLQGYAEEVAKLNAQRDKDIANAMESGFDAKKLKAVLNTTLKEIELGNAQALHSIAVFEAKGTFTKEEAADARAAVTKVALAEELRALEDHQKDMEAASVVDTTDIEKGKQAIADMQAKIQKEAEDNELRLIKVKQDAAKEAIRISQELYQSEIQELELFYAQKTQQIDLLEANGTLTQEEAAAERYAITLKEYGAKYQAAVAYRAKLDTLEGATPEQKANADQAIDKSAEATTDFQNKELVKQVANRRKAADKIEKIGADSLEKQTKFDEDEKKAADKLADDITAVRKDLTDKISDLADKRAKRAEEAAKEELQAEKQLAADLANIHATADDKVRAIKQRDMSDSAKEADNSRAAYSKLKEGLELVAAAKKNNDTAALERGKELLGQASDIGGALADQGKAIGFVRSAEEGLDKARNTEKYLADLEKIRVEKEKIAEEDKQAGKDNIDATYKISLLNKVAGEAATLEDKRHAREMKDLAEELAEWNKKLAVAQKMLGAAVASTGETGAADSAATPTETGQGHGTATYTDPKTGETVTKTITDAGNAVSSSLSKTADSIDTSGREASASVAKAGTDVANAGTGQATKIPRTISDDGIVTVGSKETGTISISASDYAKFSQKETKAPTPTTKDKLGTLTENVRNVGVNENGLRIIGPDDQARLEKYAKTASTMFSETGVSDGKQKVQDMATVLNGVGKGIDQFTPGTPKKYYREDPNTGKLQVEPLQGGSFSTTSTAEDDFEGMKEQARVAAAEMGLILRESISSSTGESTFSLIDQAGKKVEGLSKDIKSNPLALFKEGDNVAILQSLDEVRGAAKAINKEPLNLEVNDKDVKTVSKDLQKAEKATKDFGGEVDDIDFKKPKKDATALEKATDKAFDADPVEDYADAVTDTSDILDTTVDSADNLAEAADDAYTTAEDGTDAWSKALDDVDLSDTEEALKDQQQQFEDIAEVAAEPVVVEAEVSGEKEVEALSNTTGELEDTDIDVNADVSGGEEAGQLLADEEALHDKEITITVNYVTTGDAPSAGAEVTAATGGLIGGIQKFANGGQTLARKFRALTSPYISQGSGGKEDDVPAMLQKGEFVQKRSAVSKYGVGFMAALNAGRIPKAELPHFNTGGAVGTIGSFIQNFAAGGTVLSSSMGSLKKKLEESLGVQLGSAATRMNVSLNNTIVQGSGNMRSSLGMDSISSLRSVVADSVSKFAAGGTVSPSTSVAGIAASLDKQYDEQIRIANLSGDDKLAYILKKEKDDLATVVRELAAELKQLEADYKEFVSTSTAEHLDNVATIEGDYKTGNSETDEAYNKDLADLNTSYADDVSSLSEDSTSTVADYAEALAEYQADKDELKAEYDKQTTSQLVYDATLAELKQFNELTASQYTNAIAQSGRFSGPKNSRGYTSYDSKWDRYRAQFEEGEVGATPEEQLAKISEHIKYLSEDHEFSGSSTGSSQAIGSETQLEWADKLADLTERVVDENPVTIKATYDTDLASIQKDEDESTADYKKEVADQIKDKADADSDYNTSLTDLNGTYKSDKDDLRSTHDTELLEENDSYKTSMEDAATQYADDITAAKDQAGDKYLGIKETATSDRESIMSEMASTVADAASTVEEASASISAGVTTAGSSVQGLFSHAPTQEEILKKFYKSLGIPGYNTGGFIPAVAGSTAGKDSILSMLTPGEFVIKESAVNMFGAGFFESLNNFRIPKFNVGGMVGSSSIASAAASVTKHIVEFSTGTGNYGPFSADKSTIDAFLGDMALAKLRA